MKNIRVFLYENFQFLEVKFSIYLNRRVFVMYKDTNAAVEQNKVFNFIFSSTYLFFFSLLY